MKIDVVLKQTNLSKSPPGFVQGHLKQNLKALKVFIPGLCTDK